MKIKHIRIANYKTYRTLDLDLNVTEDRPIILVGGANGCGKTTLFDGIYAALYGLTITTQRQFEELFNAGVKNEEGLDGKQIMLEVTFTGNVLGKEVPYKLKRTYQLFNGKPLESVELNMDGNRFVYGSKTPAQQRAMNEKVVNSIIAANLPAELSNYFLFDAMKTSDLVKEEQINKLIMHNINSVMGFSKYNQLHRVADLLLGEKKAARLENENQRKEYEELRKKRAGLVEEAQKADEDYARALVYANEHKEHYERIKAGRENDDTLRDKIRQLETAVEDYYKREAAYRTDADALVRDLEKLVLYPKLAAMMKAEIEVVVNEKKRIEDERSEMLSERQIERISHDIAAMMLEQYGASIDEEAVKEWLRGRRAADEEGKDRYQFLTDGDVQLLEGLIRSPYVNPFVTLDEKREQLNQEMAELPRRHEQIKEYRMMLGGTDYSAIELYEANENRIKELRQRKADIERDAAELDKRIATYDYDIPQVPDPQYDVLCKLPDFFKALSSRLLAAKKSSIERMMKEQLNINLVIYAGYIGRVELSSENSDEINFKIYHKNGNEIFLSQLNAGAKQTVMQVLLKVLYELGDYEPPVMIDTVMGVLDKESREVIIEKYFPDLAHQTILLSTDTEITTERDFKKIQAFVAHCYTLHRDKDAQCTTVSEDYFGLTPSDF